MVVLKRKYLAASFGSLLIFSLKALFLLASVFFVIKSNAYADTFFSIIAYVLLSLAILWSLELLYFFQEISINQKGNFVIKTARIFKTELISEKINSVQAFQTFFDEFFGTFSIKITFLDEDGDEDEIVVHGIILSCLNNLKKHFKKKLSLSMHTSTYFHEDGKLLEVQPMKSNKSNLINNKRLGYLYRQVKFLWLFNLIILILVLFLFVHFLAQPGTNTLQNAQTSSNFESESVTTVDNEANAFYKVLVFQNNSSLERIVLYSEKIEGRNKLGIKFNTVPDLYETTTSFELRLYAGEDLVFKYSYDYSKGEPVDVGGNCFKSGVVNTENPSATTFFVTSDYNFEIPVCTKINRAVLRLIQSDSSVKEFVAQPESSS